MTFEQWMEEMSKVTFFSRVEGNLGNLNVLNKMNDLIDEDLDEDEPQEKV